MSSISGIHSSGGIFTVTGADGKAQQVDLGTLMMMLNLQRTENLDNQLAVQLAEIQERNDRVKDLTALLSECRRRKAEGEGGEIGSDPKAPSGKNFGDVFHQECGGTGSWVSIGGKRPDKNPEAWEGRWDANINAIKSKIDLLNNDSQMANIKLQNLLEKRNNAFEMATKVMDTNNQSVQSTLRNL